MKDPYLPPTSTIVEINSEPQRYHRLLEFYVNMRAALAGYGLGCLASDWPYFTLEASVALFMTTVLVIYTSFKVLDFIEL